MRTSPLQVMAVVALSIGLASAMPQRRPLVVTSTVPNLVDVEDNNANNEEEKGVPGAKPIVSEFAVRSDVQFRYARTVVNSYVKNPSSEAQEITFSLVMPEKAFISNFSMLLGEEELVAEVAEKEEARATYDEAMSGGQAAGLVDQDTRDANLVTVSVNVEPLAKARFSLTYEELLERKLGRYEHNLHLNPGQVTAEKVVVRVFINESLPVTDVSVPEIKSDPNAITSDEQNPLAKIVRDPQDETKVLVEFEADRTAQKEFGESGIAGQFLVHYDVDRQHDEGDVQILDGYFVHFFSPEKIETLPKHVVFVLDVSGSMYGTKLDQTKDAMVTVLDDLSDKDFFNVLTFSDEVYHWVPEAEKLKEGPHSLTYQGTEDLRDEALTYSLQLETIGGTNINDAMLAALQLVKEVKVSEEVPAEAQSIIIFLTDGEPTTGVTSGQQIRTNVKDANEDLKVPVYGLAFGKGADFDLVKKLSSENDAFARKIYEGSDAAIQLEDFYREIANPLLSDVTFEYVGEKVGNGSSSTTARKFGVFNRGNEIVVAGKIDPDFGADDGLEVIIKGKGVGGDVERRIAICPPTIDDAEPIPRPMPKVLEQVESTTVHAVNNVLHVSPIRPVRPVFPIGIVRPFPCIPFPPLKPIEPRSQHENFIERLWAFMTIKEYLDEKPTATQERREELMAAVPTTTTTAASSTTTTVTNKLPFEEKDDKAIVAAPPVPEKKEETNKDKALKLALQYNFVTPVTSLVVTRPNATAAGGNETEQVPIEPVPVSSASLRNNHHFGRTGYSGGGGMRRTMMASMPSSRTGGGSFNRRKFSAVPMMSPGGGFMSKSAHGGIQTRGRPAPMPIQATHSLASFPGPNFAYDDYDDDMFMEADDMSFGTTSTTTAKTTCSGTLTLFAQSYGRGNGTAVTADVEFLSSLDFDDRLKSLKVEGDCCWRIYSDNSFAGNEQLFRKGVYDSPAKMPKLVKKASSVRRVVNC